MATTDAKPGFRLPWSAERSEPDAPAETAGDVPVSEALPQDQEIETPHMIDASSAATDPMTTADQGSAAPEAVAEENQPIDSAPEALESPAPASTNGRKPNKFMADLTRAMQGAAETAKADALARFSADAKAHIESIHATNAVEATELRKQADDDVASVREWSKAEIARIREETDERITHRKERLEREIEAHAGDIEGRIERVQRRVDAFEAEMAAFFERLLAEEDATRFAAMAESLPEPPPFDSEAGDDAPIAEASYPETADLPAERSVVVDPWPEAPDEGVTETLDNPETEASGETIDAFDTESVGHSLGERIGESFNGTVTTVGEPTTDAPLTETETPVSEATESDATEPVAEAEVTEPEAVDPRLDALGLAPSFEAAEAEAAAFTPDESPAEEEIAVIADDALAARIAGLVPDAESAGTESSMTRVVVTGLVSVASIAGFKRQLSRVAGVLSVGVSSGPDGEFLFAVTHDTEIVLRDAITTLPGFGARVTAEAPGELTVTARDPESEG